MRACAYLVATGARQSGHVVLTRSHVAMHSSWKAWPHGGNIRAASRSPNSARHTAHSGLSPPPGPAGAATCKTKNTGTESRGDGDGDDSGTARRGGEAAGSGDDASRAAAAGRRREDEEAAA